MQVLGVVDDKDEKGKQVYGMVMPRLARSLRTLLDHSAGGEGVPLTTRLRIIEELARALAFVHADGVVHADLKSLNVLLDDGNHAQLTDFGLATTKQLASSTEASLRSVQSPTFVGTYEWGAPETHPQPDTGECGVPTFKSDVYSLGTIFFEVVTDAVPFRAAPNVRNRAAAIPALILKGRRPADFVPYPDDVPKDMRALIADCWAADPSARPSARDVVARVRAICEAMSPATDVNASFVEQLKARLLDPHAVPMSRADLEALIVGGGGDSGSDPAHPCDASSRFHSASIDGGGRPSAATTDTARGGEGSSVDGRAYETNPSTPDFSWVLSTAAVKARTPLFSQCDADGDGFVQPHDLVCLMTDPSFGPALLARDAELIELADVDCDGKLNAIEFQLLLHAAVAGMAGALPPPTAADVAAASIVMKYFNMTVGAAPDGSTKLHALAAAGATPQIRDVLARHVNPDVANKAGARPLHVVASADAARALLESGADVNVRDAMGRTPLDVATCDDVRAVLRAAGGTRVIVSLPPAPTGRAPLVPVAPPTVVLSERSTATVLTGHTGSVTSLAVFPDGRLASGSADNTVRVWAARSVSCTLTLSGHTGSVTSLAVLPGGRLASGSDDSDVCVWDVRSGSCATTLSGHSNWVRSLAVLPDGRLASGSGDNTVCVWDMHNNSCAMTLSGHTSLVYALAVLPDGRLASGSADRTVRVLDLCVGATAQTLYGHTGSVSSLAVLPGGYLASGSYDNTIRVWDVRSGSCAMVLSGHIGSVYALAVLPDGRLACGSGDATVRVWDVRKGLCALTLSGRSGRVSSLAVLPDGRLASGCVDNTVRVWS